MNSRNIRHMYATTLVSNGFRFQSESDEDPLSFHEAMKPAPIVTEEYLTSDPGFLKNVK